MPDIFEEMFACASDSRAFRPDEVKRLLIAVQDRNPRKILSIVEDRIAAGLDGVRTEDKAAAERTLFTLKYTALAAAAGMKTTAWNLASSLNKAIPDGPEFRGQKDLFARIRTRIALGGISLAVIELAMATGRYPDGTTPERQSRILENAKNVPGLDMDKLERLARVLDKLPDKLDAMSGWTD